MGCECMIDLSIDGIDGVAGLSFIRTDSQNHTCCECKGKINAGDKYEELDDKRSTILNYDFHTHCYTYTTCLDCVSIRDNLFCNFYIGQIWDDFARKICENPEPPAAECMMMLTKPARDKVCDMIEKQWEAEDNE